MTFNSPVFWYHQAPRAHQLPDARSDVKGRTVLRKIRAGYATISPQRTASPAPSLRQSPQLEPQEIVEPQVADPFADVEEPTQEPSSQDPRPLTPPDYESLDHPPAYAHPLPPALPGYTPLPGVIAEPIREDIAQNLKQRKRYRDVLRRRIGSTKKIFRGDDSDAEGSESDSLCESESTRGVVLYRHNDQWVGTTNATPVKDEVLPRQRGFRGWMKRAWQRCLDFSAEHPYLFLLAIFIIVVVALCLLI